MAVPPLQKAAQERQRRVVIQARNSSIPVRLIAPFPTISGWVSARKIEKRRMHWAMESVVLNALPEARRKRHHRLTASRSQGWLMTSK